MNRIGVVYPQLLTVKYHDVKPQVSCATDADGLEVKEGVATGLE